MWLKVPVEERDENGKRHMTGGRSSRCGTPQGGIVSPMLANLYMNRFLQKHVQSKGPSLHRRDPVSLVHLTLSDSQTGRRLSYDVGGATSAHLGLPQLPKPPSLHAVLNTPVDWIRCTCWFLPCPCCLPRLIGGSASTTKLSRPAQASLALRPAKLLAHHAWAFSRGFIAAGCPVAMLVSYQTLPTSIWAGPSPAGDPRRWGAL